MTTYPTVDHDPIYPEYTPQSSSPDQIVDLSDTSVWTMIEGAVSFITAVSDTAITCNGNLANTHANMTWFEGPAAVAGKQYLFSLNLIDPAPSGTGLGIIPSVKTPTGHSGLGMNDWDFNGQTMFWTVSGTTLGFISDDVDMNKLRSNFIIEPDGTIASYIDGMAFDKTSGERIRDKHFLVPEEVAGKICIGIRSLDTTAGTLGYVLTMTTLDTFPTP